MALFMRRRDRHAAKAQSAMEYLMTYGWAILIISVVLGALYQIGAFNSSSLTVRAPAGECKVLRTSAAVNLVGQCSGMLPKYVAQLDGASSYVSGISDPGSTATITGWFSFSQVAMSKGSSEGVLGNVYQHSANNFLYFWGTNDYFGYPFSSTNTWYFIAIEYSGGVTTGATLYVNGVAYSVTQQTGAHSVIGMTSIGGPYGSVYFPGFISNIQTYNTTLDSDSITKLYQEGIGGAPVKLQNLVGWWPLNGDTNDYSGKNNNGVQNFLTFASQYGK